MLDADSADVSPRIRRIGMITPSANTCLESVTSQILAQLPNVSAHYTRIAVRRVALDGDSARQFGADTMLHAAQLLADAEVDCIAWNGTAGSWLGLDHDYLICRRIEESTGIRSTTSTLGLVQCLESAGIERYALVAPFPDDILAKIVRTYEDRGFSCVKALGLALRTTLEKDRVPRGRIRGLLSAAAATHGAQAVLVVCTNFRAAPLVEEIERAYGLPVFDSVTVTLWDCLQIVGGSSPIRGWGSLMAGEIATSAHLRPSYRKDVPRIDS